MAGWGKINDDRLYGLITFDLDRAFALAGLREYEAIIVQVMREHSWGPARRKAKDEPWPDATPYSLPLNALATALGVPLPRLSEAKARLLASNILIPAEGGYLINKEADKWTDPATGAPRLTDAKVAYALSAPKRRKKVTPIRNQEVTPIRNLETEEVTPIRNQRLRETVSQVTPIRNLHTKEDRAHDLEIREIREREDDNARATDDLNAEKARRGRIADRITAEVFELTDSDGNADPDHAAMFACLIGDASEAAVELAAREAKALGDDPIAYFRKMCRNGLKEPAAGPRPSANGSPAPTATDRRNQQIQQGVAARVAKSRGNPS